MTGAKKKHIMIIVLVLVLLILFLNVGINGSPWDAGGCVSISFDKWDMMTADKVVIWVGEEQYTTTDASFIRALAYDSLAGTFSEYCCSHLDYDMWVEIYKGDRLVRRMRWIENHDSLAYEADPTHWVLFGEEGHAFLSRDVWERLHGIIGKG